MRTLFSAAALAALLLGSTAARADDPPLWLRYPAISPDGTQIAFTFGGRIYKVPAEGGAATLLTTSDVYASLPVWSPDGETIAFAADRYGNYDVFSMPADGGAATRLTSHSRGEVPSGFTADGTAVLFNSSRLGDSKASYTLPSLGQHRQLYAVPAFGGRERMVLPILALEAVESPLGNLFLYEDQPGIEQEWRKHQVSAEARDVWLYNAINGRHDRLSTFAGEDRDPAWAPDGQSFYYLSERSGSFNVWFQPLDATVEPVQITFHDKHPVRFLSVSQTGDIAYSYDGELWRLPAGAVSPEKLAVTLPQDAIDRGTRYVTFDHGATEFDLSPNGTEIAFVARGEVFAMSIDGEVTRRVTDTPEQERNVSFSPDGRTLLYASERGGSWGLYSTSILLDEEPEFFDATLLEETIVLDTPADEFQPLYDPAGGRIAYLENRETMRVLDLETGDIRTVLGEEFNYSYSDGDISFDWSPDGRWLAASYAPNFNNPDIAVVDTVGNQPPVNVAPNGYYDFGATWSADGRYILWLSDLLGLRRSDQNIAQVDVLVAAATREAADRLTLGEKDLARLLRQEAEEDSTEESETSADEASVESPEEVAGSEETMFEAEGIERRIFRLTPFSASIGYYHLSADGETLTYIIYEPQADGSWSATGYQLRHRTTQLTQLFSGLLVDWIDAEISSDESTLYMLSPWGFYEVSLYDGSYNYISYAAEMALDTDAERASIFDHVWRLTEQKFYSKDLHGVDWLFYGQAYRRFLPYITHGNDFAELLSEMVGELNASHTGSGYYKPQAGADSTASLGLFYDSTYEGPGIAIAAVLRNGPADKAGSRIGPGVVIDSVDGQGIGADDDIHPLLNRRAGRDTRLGLRDPATGETWEEVLQPITQWEETRLAYWYWIDQRRALVAELSGGRIGYVHVPQMDEEAYRQVYTNIFGRYANAEALVVDIRFNQGGNLTNQLLTLLGGKLYLNWVPGDQGGSSPEPYNRWVRPTIVVTNPAAYSDGHIFPHSYKALGLGKLVGEPVPGTGTAVWWEDQQDPALYYGVPQAGFKDLNGAWLENQQQEPDIFVSMLPEDRVRGRDPQLEAAVLELLEELDR